MDEKPDCYACVHRRRLPGDCHSRCNNVGAKVVGHDHGMSMGWFKWPVNFDPVWLVSCDGFSDRPEDNLPEAELPPLLEIWGLLR